MVPVSAADTRGSPLSIPRRLVDSLSLCPCLASLRPGRGQGVRVTGCGDLGQRWNRARRPGLLVPSRGAGSPTVKSSQNLDGRSVDGRLAVRFDRLRIAAWRLISTVILGTETAPLGVAWPWPPMTYKYVHLLPVSSPFSFLQSNQHSLDVLTTLNLLFLY